MPIWSPQCEEVAGGSTAAGASNNAGDGLLENAIHQHQSLYELMCLNYTEVYLYLIFLSDQLLESFSFFPVKVHSTSKKLLYQLDHLVQLANQTKPEYSSSEKQVHFALEIDSYG